MADCGSSRGNPRISSQLDLFWSGDGKDCATASKGRWQTWGLKRNFLFLGRRTDVPEILGCCDIAVLPSRAEGLPNAVLEYMAARLPSIVSTAGGNAELIEDGVTGLLVPPEDSAALAGGLLKLLRDPRLARQLGG